MLCPKCGFDSGRDYERYPTFGAVKQVASTSAMRRKWQNKQKAQRDEKSVAPPVIVLTPSVLPRKKRYLRTVLIVAVVAFIFGIGIGFTAGLGNGQPEPSEPEESVQMQESSGTTDVGKAWERNILRSDTILFEENNGYWVLEARAYPVLGSDYQREMICSITFLDTLEDAPEDSWDVSEAGNGTVLAWVKPNGEQYDLYIGANGGVCAGESCKDLFAGYIFTENITFGDAFHTENVKDMDNMFFVCTDLTHLDLTGFDTSSVRNMSGMFSLCTGLSSLDLSSFNTANVTDMGSMFKECEKLMYLDLRGFDTANVRQMGSMFAHCFGLSDLDLSGFDTANVQSMSDMFFRCGGLKNLILGDHFVTSNAETYNMFYECPAGEKYAHLVH